MSAKKEGKDWEAFVSAREAYLMAIRRLRRFPPEGQAAVLREALKTDQELDMMEYLRTVEDPSMPSFLKVAPLLVAELGSFAAYPGENAPAARENLGTLARIPSRRDDVLAMADRRTADCFAHPEDEETWINTGEMLRGIDPRRFDAFMEQCRSHPSEKIRGVAEFFET